MKSEFIEGRHYIECACGNPRHMFCVDLAVWEDEPDVYYGADVYIMSNWKAPLYTRIIAAFKYIFTGSEFSVGDSIIIDRDNIDQFKQMVKELEKSFKKNSKLLKKANKL